MDEAFAKYSSTWRSECCPWKTHLRFLPMTCVADNNKRKTNKSIGTSKIALSQNGFRRCRPIDLLVENSSPKSSSERRNCGTVMSNLFTNFASSLQDPLHRRFLSRRGSSAHAISRNKFHAVISGMISSGRFIGAQCSVGSGTDAPLFPSSPLSPPALPGRVGSLVPPLGGARRPRFSKTKVVFISGPNAFWP